jgi:hypothetical protein
MNVQQGETAMTDKDAEEINALYQEGSEGLGFKTQDDAAERIGALYRKAAERDPFLKGELPPRKHPAVTRIRHLSGRMSGSRNADHEKVPTWMQEKYPVAFPEGRYREGTNGWLSAQPQSPHVCYYCRERFAPEQMRYRIMHSTASGWGPALLCMDCFKVETDDSVLGIGRRHNTKCPACSRRSIPFAIHAGCLRKRSSAAIR